MNYFAGVIHYFAGVDLLRLCVGSIEKYFYNSQTFPHALRSTFFRIKCYGSLWHLLARRSAHKFFKNELNIPYALKADLFGEVISSL